MIEVVDPGLLTSIQTADGRPGWRHLGVPVGGAADAWSARLANRLVGNPDDSALLELTLIGPSLRFLAATVVALTGGISAITDHGVPVPKHAGRAVPAGTLIHMLGGSGARGYLAVGGGFVVEPMLASRATDLRSGFGGHKGRALRAGDRLAIGRPSGMMRRWIGDAPAGPIRVVRGPHEEAFDSLIAGQWEVGVEADRTGVRLDGPRLRSEGEVPSMGLPIGAIQVPPDARPIVMLADRPVTGGYPVPACVIRADIGRVAQLSTGDRVLFQAISPAQARLASREREEQLAALDALFRSHSTTPAG